MKLCKIICTNPHEIFANFEYIWLVLSWRYLVKRFGDLVRSECPIAIFMIFFLFSSDPQCNEVRCNRCNRFFKGNTENYDCQKQCKRCNLCIGPFANLGVCKKHCTNGVDECINTCQKGKSICLKCDCEA